MLDFWCWNLVLVLNELFNFFVQCVRLIITSLFRFLLCVPGLLFESIVISFRLFDEWVHKIRLSHCKDALLSVINDNRIVQFLCNDGVPVLYNDQFLLKEYFDQDIGDPGNIF